MGNRERVKENTLVDNTPTKEREERTQGNGVTDTITEE